MAFILNILQNWSFLPLNLMVIFNNHLINPLTLFNNIWYLFSFEEPLFSLASITWEPSGFPAVSRLFFLWPFYWLISLWLYLSPQGPVLVFLICFYILFLEVLSHMHRFYNQADDSKFSMYNSIPNLTLVSNCFFIISTWASQKHL